MTKQCAFAYLLLLPVAASWCCCKGHGKCDVESSGGPRCWQTQSSLCKQWAICTEHCRRLPFATNTSVGEKEDSATVVNVGAEDNLTILTVQDQEMAATKMVATQNPASVNVGSCKGFDNTSYGYCDEPQGSMWCWAAAATEIATHFVYPTVWCSSICQVVGHKRGQDCCGSPAPQACWNQDGNGYDVASAINWATSGRVQYYYHQSALSSNNLPYYLQFGPLVVFIQWHCGANDVTEKPSYCGGHFMTIMGCVQRAVTTSYYVHDVGNDRGNYQILSYSKLATYVPPSNTQISGTWTGTLYPIGMASTTILNETVIVV